MVVPFHGDTYRVVEAVKHKIAHIQRSLPPGVLIPAGYDRSLLINRAISTLSDSLTEEMIVVALIGRQSMKAWQPTVLARGA